MFGRPSSATGRAVWSWLTPLVGVFAFLYAEGIKRVMAGGLRALANLLSDAEGAKPLRELSEAPQATVGEPTAGLSDAAAAAAAAAAAGAAATAATTATPLGFTPNPASASAGSSGVFSGKTGGEELELLVHNVSHSDMVLSLTTLRQALDGNEGNDLELGVNKRIFARPKFSLFQSSCSALLRWMGIAPGQRPGASDAKNGALESSHCPVVSRNEGDARHPLMLEPASAAGAVGGGLRNASAMDGGAGASRAVTGGAGTGGTGTGGAAADEKSPPGRDDLVLPVGFHLRRPCPISLCVPDSGDGQAPGTAGTLVTTLLKHFRLRGNDHKKLMSEKDQEHGASDGPLLDSDDGPTLQTGVGIDGVHFPLMASIIPRWLQDGYPAATVGAVTSGAAGGSAQTPASRRSQKRVVKMIYLVSGVGVPRDQKVTTSDPDGNSTEATARLLEVWLLAHYPGLVVKRLHSRTNVFRYDENITFVKRELLPDIEALRDAKAREFGASWRDKFRLTVSFASGSPARIAAIQAALRPYRPTFMHMWQLKTFWQYERVSLDDIESMECEDMETMPAVPMFETPLHVQLVVQRLRDVKRQFDAVVDESSFLSAISQAKQQGSATGGAAGTSGFDVLQSLSSASDKPPLPKAEGTSGGDAGVMPCTSCSGQCGGHDMAAFWHRKTKKVVLAVLLVVKNGVPKTYVGINLEVSMPTGSLCAERNAIGSALADDLSLHRTDLKVVAVLGCTLPAAKKGKATKPRTSGQADPAITKGKRVWATNTESNPLPNPRAAAPSGAQFTKGGAVAAETAVCSGSSRYGDEAPPPPPTSPPPPPLTIPIAGTERRASTGGLGGKSGNPRAQNLQPSRTRPVPSEEKDTEVDEVPESPPRIRKIRSYMLGDDTAGGQKDLTLSPAGSLNGGLSPLYGSDNDMADQAIPPPFSLGAGQASSRGDQGSSDDGGGGFQGRPHSSSNAGSDSRAHSHSFMSDGTVDSVRPTASPRFTGAVTPSMTTQTVSVKEKDTNPMAPCGACREWLKKIAEVNPSFQIVTFTDESMSGVYSTALLE